ncbi:ABC transporter permease [Nocardia sp. NBC_01503]|uniref:MlaE family ABC transporter permease n=1 Tax=Nocardia sp. NBC_01503 TaxID=2975997 RepID=UPI002E7B9A3B|nr:ABC transporter permease [Nocardia sp. NBC_01503]WTL32148.1 ABC transporter permease [Nocardia sp. NBC_01503]
MAQPDSATTLDRVADVLNAPVDHLSGVGRASAATLGRSILLGTSIVRHLVRDVLAGRLPFGEFVQQAWHLLKVTAVPAILMAIPFGAVVSVQVGGLVHQVGADSLIGAASGLGIIRQGAPLAAGLLLGGAGAAAIAADLGARAIREELDAMRVMGVDPVQRLLVPRFLALLVISPMLFVAIVMVGVGSSYLVAVEINGVSRGSFWASFGAFATTADLAVAVIKTLVAAVLVAIIAGLRGLEARGGPRGVADAVNSAVVLSVTAIILATLLITQLQAMFLPGHVA